MHRHPHPPKRPVPRLFRFLPSPTRLHFSSYALAGHLFFFSPLHRSIPASLRRSAAKRSQPKPPRKPKKPFIALKTPLLPSPARCFFDETKPPSHLSPLVPLVPFVD